MKKIFILTILNLFTLIKADNLNYQFKRLTIKEGLSNSTVNAITQDRLGFIWIGTENGLNRFDGYNFTHYFADPENPTGLKSNEILTLLIDNKDQLWVGTFDGLYTYNQAQNKFYEVKINQVNLTEANIPVYSLYQDSKENIWVGTSGNGLIKLNSKGQFIDNYHHKSNDRFSISSNFIFSILEDKKGNLWIGTTDNGIDCYDTKRGIFKNFKPIKNVEYQQNVNAILKIYQQSDSTFLLGTRGDGIFSLNINTKKFSPFYIEPRDASETSSYEVYEIFKDSSSRLWVSVHGKGLFCYPQGNAKALKFEHNSSISTSLINNSVRTIFEDKQGNLWIASFQGGVNVLPNVIKRFDSYNLNKANTAVQNYPVTAITTDKKNRLWVGTDGNGLKMIDPSHTKIKHFQPSKDHKISLPDKVVMSLLADDDKLWIGTYLGGLSILDIPSGKFKNYTANGNKGDLNVNFITCIYKARNGVIWLGTNGGGINRYDKETDSFSSLDGVVDENNLGLINRYINTISEDNNGRLWIGTYWGISIYDPYDGLFLNFKKNSNIGLSNNTIYNIIHTSKNEVWLGTRDGLNHFIPQRNCFESFNIKDGLPGNVIYAIEEGNNGKLWLSTNNGLCCFDPTTHQTKNYFTNDGLLSNEFFRTASYKSATGELFFGGINGLNSFFADSLNENYTVPTPQIVGFKIFNKTVKPNTKVDGITVLEKSILETDTIILKQRLNSFEFEFSALDFILPEKNNYRCILEGFDQKWHELSAKQRYITYTNLDPGNYIFKVKASSIDNQFTNQYKAITIIITPPWYKTWLAKSTWILLFCSFLGLIARFTLRRVKLKNQIKLERIERSKIQEINQAKLQFFTNISHEFRTPISLIIGPLQTMSKDSSVARKYSDKIELMIKNSNRLLRLVNQLMDMRKIENNKMKLNVQYHDIITFLTSTYTNFVDLSQQKNIDYTFDPSIEKKMLWLDLDKLDKIMFNLLSNAFKFTPNYGEIKIKCDLDEEGVNITVSDTGKGISEDELDKIFDRFYQAGKESSNPSLGSGIGLSLTKSLIEQHHGNIHVTSTKDHGTTFTVFLPDEDSLYTDEDKTESSIKEKNSFTNSYVLPNTEIPKTITHENKPTILIVEDNDELRRYLIGEFNLQYNVLEATNGEEGLEIALSKLPDIVVSDVMMPKMDGLELCNQIKSHFLTNHIPIILLTAKTSIEQRIEGLKHGADSYIPKPFAIEHLQVRINKLIEIRQTLRKRFTNNDKSSPTEHIYEDLYLKQVDDFIIKNIDDLDLNIESLCQDLGISRSHFYRKIKYLTGKSPTEYIRHIRLNKAAEILSKTNKSISEVCYCVGFNSPSYFSVCFKQQYKMTPLEFVKRNTDMMIKEKNE